MYRPSPLKATEVTQPWCPVSSCSRAPVWRSHTATVLSLGARDDVPPVAAQRHGIHPILVPGKNSQEGGGFAVGSPAEHQIWAGKRLEPMLRSVGQLPLPEGRRPEQELLGEAPRLVLAIPVPQVIGFASKAAEQRGQGVSGPLLCLGGELQCGDQRLLHEIHALGLDGVFERGEIFERLGDAPGAGVAKLRGLGFRRQGPGELADQRVQADPLLVQLLDQPDIVQPLEGTLERRRIARPAGQGHAREQAERGDRDGRGLGELPGHPEDKPSRFIAWPQRLPLGLQGRSDGGLVDRLEVDRGQVRDLGIEGRQTALLFEPHAVVGQGDLRPLGEEGAGELEGEREIAKHPADRRGPGPLRVVSDRPGRGAASHPGGATGGRAPPGAPKPRWAGTCPARAGGW